MFNTISSQASKLFDITRKKKLKSKTKIIAITSGKGGVGKSTICANMAYLLAKNGKNIAVLDADIGLANMQILFNAKPQLTIYDYIQKNAKLEDILYKTIYTNITLIAGKSGHNYITNNSKHYIRMVEDIINMNRFDLLIIDTGAGLSEYVQEFLDIADEIIAITTTDPSALTDVYALLKMVSKSKERLFLLFNQTANYTTGKSITNSLKELALKNRLNKDFMVKYIGNIVSNQTILTTGRLRKLFAKEFGGSSFTMDLEKIIQKLELEIKWL